MERGTRSLSLSILAHFSVSCVANGATPFHSAAVPSVRAIWRPQSRMPEYCLAAAPRPSSWRRVFTVSTGWRAMASHRPPRGVGGRVVGWGWRRRIWRTERTPWFRGRGEGACARACEKNDGRGSSGERVRDCQGVRARPPGVRQEGRGPGRGGGGEAAREGKPEGRGKSAGRGRSGRNECLSLPRSPLVPLRHPVLPRWSCAVCLLTG